MGYHVKVEELHMVLQIIRAQIEQWQEQLIQVQSELGLLQNTVAIQGKTGDSIRSYVSEVQNVVVEALQQALIEYDMKITLYVNGYVGVDGSENAKLMQERFAHQQQLLTQEMSGFQSLGEEIVTTITGVNDIISVSLPNGNIVTDSFTQMGTFLQELNTKVGEYEERHKTDSQSVESMLDTIDTIITERAGTGVNASNYVPGSYIMNPAYSALKNQMGTSAEYTGDNRDVYQKALENEKRVQMLDIVERAFDSGDVNYENYTLLKWFANHADNIDDIRNTAGGIIDILYSPGFTMLKDGVRITVKKAGDQYYMKLAGDAITGTNKMTWKELQAYLKNNIKDINWDKYDVKTLTRDGIKIGSFKGDKYFDKLSKDFSNISEDISDVYKMAAEGEKTKYAREMLKRGFKETGSSGVNPLKNLGDWKNVSKIEKVGKSLGLLGDVYTIGSNVNDNFHEDGEVKISIDRMQDFVTDTAVDVGSSAASVATGAAIGSLVGPVGTVVGAAAGFVIDTVINLDVKDWDGDDEKDSLVDGAKILLDSGCDWIGEKLQGLWG
ncbi:MAG: T7SS effector LXG polymorphic toxin [Lachnospiraceae bacterium]